MGSDNRKKAVVLLSGGMDSAVVAAMAAAEGFAVHALTFDYGQRHRVELAAAKRQAVLQQMAGHTIFPLPLHLFGGSALTDDIPVPRRAGEAKEGSPGAAIPVTYVPARNAVFLSVALSFAEAIGAADIFIGVSAVDYSGYPDCRPAFIEAFGKVANLGTRMADGGPGFTIHAPLQYLSKEETVRRGLSLGVDFGVTRTCYDPAPDGTPCGTCDACCLREKGFAAAGVVDPGRSPMEENE